MALTDLSGLIELDKFVASFITEMKECSQMRNFSIPMCIKKALDDQGLEYKDGEIVKTQRRVSAEAKETGYGESEDERIKKEITNIIMQSTCNTEEEFYRKRELIDWLEKQGTSYTKRDVDDAYVEGMAFAKDELEKQKPAWSEEDDSMFQSCIGAVATNDYYKGEEKEQIYDWLKSLKNRVQPKQEWSEQEQVRINRIVACLENLNVADNDILFKDVDWLKSLKQRIGG